jgi:glutathione S-transferase
LKSRRGSITLAVMKLYYSPGACSLAADIVLHEAKLKADFVKVDLKTKKTEKGDDFNAVNPKGYVPALQLDDGEVLTENVAVLQYLASLEPRLLPATGMAKWHGIEALAFVSTEIHKAFKPLFDPSAADDVKSKAKEQIAKRLGNAEKIMGGRDFIVGDAFTVVDAYLFVMLMWSDKQGVTIPSALKHYASRLRERPSVKEALSLEGLDAKA